MRAIEAEPPDIIGLTRVGYMAHVIGTSFGVREASVHVDGHIFVVPAMERMPRWYRRITAPMTPARHATHDAWQTRVLELHTIRLVAPRTITPRFLVGSFHCGSYTGRIGKPPACTRRARTSAR